MFIFLPEIVDRICSIVYINILLKPSHINKFIIVTKIMPSHIYGPYMKLQGKSYNRRLAWCFLLSNYNRNFALSRFVKYYNDFACVEQYNIYLLLIWNIQIYFVTKYIWYTYDELNICNYPVRTWSRETCNDH